MYNCADSSIETSGFPLFLAMFLFGRYVTWGRAQTNWGWRDPEAMWRGNYIIQILNIDNKENHLLEKY